jgi:hypothetical protein
MVSPIEDETGTIVVRDAPENAVATRVVTARPWRKTEKALL